MTDLSKMNWQPIETAPNDGTRVLVSNGKHIWLSSRKITNENYQGAPTVGHDWCSGYAGSETTHPTHWQPLPDPPRAAEQDGEL